MRWATYNTCRSGLMDNANGPPDTGISACGVSLPLSASRLKAAILLSSCRQTYKEDGMVLISSGFCRRRVLLHFTTICAEPHNESLGKYSETTRIVGYRVRAAPGAKFIATASGVLRSPDWTEQRAFFGLPADQHFLSKAPAALCAYASPSDGAQYLPGHRNWYCRTCRHANGAGLSTSLRNPWCSLSPRSVYRIRCEARFYRLLPYG